MNRNVTSKITFLAATALAISSGLGFVRVPADKAYSHKGARKNSGGRPYKRFNSPRYKAWKRAFGGIACPTYTE